MAPPSPHRNVPKGHFGAEKGELSRRSVTEGLLPGVRGKGKGPAGPFPSLRTEPALRAVPVFRSAYFPKKPFGFFYKTLDLQVRCAHPPDCTRFAAAQQNCTH